MNVTTQTGSRPLRVLLAVFASFLLLAAGCAADQEGGRGTSEREERAAAETAASEEGVWPVARVASAVEPSVVQVNVAAIQTTPFGPREAQGTGSGVIYREDGYVITNNHVVEGARTVNVAFADGSVETGRVVGTDPFTDIAVVKVRRGDLPVADFADGGDLVVGQLAVAMGSPSGFQSTVTSGVISGLGREVPPEITGGSQQSALVDLIQTDAAISPGSSGGALVDRDANVIGINVAYLPPAQTGAVNIGFAIPAATATDVAEQIIEDGRAEHPYLGVGLADLTPEIARRFDISVESGALVTRVDPEGPASDAGIEPGGVITAVRSERVRSAGDLLSALRRYDPGEPLDITVAKGGETRELVVELEEKG
ncbi:MAG: trypsin-like peptidase domain-containing protein [Actinomycetota bacterium]|nr:trypsin-like peptidase domain-containing protein [Actinomycetota bacterium]